MNDPRLEELIEEFSFLDDWEERYRYVIDLGRTLPPLAESERVEIAKVRGCASQVWLVSAAAPDTGLVEFRGQSDAAIVQGLLAILVRLYSGRLPAEILALDAQTAFQALGLGDALTPQRSNGLKAMAQRMHDVARDALAASQV
ncbi:SufE family protein [Aquidulcibacter sp.]|jgi:cysteine desulfuration protein SufE|uniref:SufE family protein n=1 Tax=Aquidulcibacter sp. TaxID=2052990 RepID=UPI00078D298C|nr:cysteine desufuration protein SufE [Hyphomonadaceae bacterium UKL13-1]OYU51519.1 MAG: cysteine desufuration protein SufE [Alphaproteobacteria bacterium PA1]HCP63521.1 cysteine desulfuration protein SufE [Hyphomonadaceae bacterium]